MENFIKLKRCEGESWRIRLLSNETADVVELSHLIGRSVIQSRSSPLVESPWVRYSIRMCRHSTNTVDIDFVV